MYSAYPPGADSNTATRPPSRAVVTPGPRASTVPATSKQPQVNGTLTDMKNTCFREKDGDRGKAWVGG